MSLHHRDLISIQEARDLVARAADAQKTFSAFSQEQVDAVVEACAKAAADNVEPLARAAVEETGFGNVPDKIVKNTLAAVEVPRAIRGMRTVGILHEDRDNGIVEVASPVGVVAAVIPSTNPTSTAIYTTLISLKSQNAIVMSPHPSAIKCICMAATVLARAALAAGAPDGLINCMQQTTLEGTRELMRHRAIGVILATGGTGLVRAAYSSGKPAYGVGPGNVPAFIERSADVRKAVADILAGKTFDYGTLCSSEQAMIAESPVRDLALEECLRQGAYFLSPEEIEKVGRLVILPGTSTANPKVVGRAATTIAEMAGIKVPAATRALVARLEPQHVGRKFPLSAEKLSPVLAFYSVANLSAGIELARRLLEFGGLGHTCAIHSQNRAAIVEFGQAMPAFRVVVNTAAVYGSIGYSTHLFPAMTLGCGAPGGNITSDNIGPQHLMNIKRIAWESRAIEHRTIPADQRMAGAGGLSASETIHDGRKVKMGVESAGQKSEPQLEPAVSPQGAGKESPVLSDRAAIARMVSTVLAASGIARGSGLPKQMESSVNGTVGARELPSPSAVASEFAARLFGAAAQPKTSAAAGAASLSASPEVSHAPPAPVPSAIAAEPAVQISPFVSENDVRRAMTRSEKIFVGPKTILTPSARDLGMEHEVFIETEAGSIR